MYAAVHTRCTQQARSVRLHFIDALENSGQKPYFKRRCYRSDNPACDHQDSLICNRDTAVRKNTGDFISLFPFVSVVVMAVVRVEAGT